MSTIEEKGKGKEGGEGEGEGEGKGKGKRKGEICSISLITSLEGALRWRRY